MFLRSRWLLVGGLLLVGCASSRDLKQRAAVVRVTQNSADVSGCELVGATNDTDMDDLREKVAKKGGDTALVVGTGVELRPSPLGWPFGASSHGSITAQAYRCR